jgi:hypothetical protein
MSGDHNLYQKKKGNKKGLFDDVLISDPERDKAWAAFIKRKDVKAMMKGKEDFKFPFDGSYDLWCIAWEKAWREGFYEGWREAGGKTREP